MEKLGIRDKGDGGKYGTFLVEADESLEVEIPPVNGKNVTVTTIPLLQLDHGTVTNGPFIVGDVVTGGTSDETAKIMAVDPGGDFIAVADNSGDFDDTEVVTGSKSGASATLSATTQGSGLVRVSTSSDDAHANDEGAYCDSDDGEVTQHNNEAIISGVTAIKLFAIDTQCRFNVVI